LLYLVTPSREVLWLQLPAGITLATAAQNDWDLAHLEWAPSEQPFSEPILKLALAHGAMASNGLILEGGFVAQATHGDRLRDSLQQLHNADAATAEGDALLEQLMPGRRAHRDRLDQAIDAQAEELIVEADDEARELIDAPPKRDLVEHWTSLGGDLPATA
jgi:hypothetical protein